MIEMVLAILKMMTWAIANGCHLDAIPAQVQRGESGERGKVL